MKRVALSPLVVAAIAVVGTAACIGGRASPSTQHYVLSPVIEAPSGGPAGPAAMRVVGVGPVSLPAYLDRPQVVMRPAPDRLDIREFAQWAEPLRDAVTRVVAVNLARLLPDSHVVTFPWRSTEKIRYQVILDIGQMDGPAGGQRRARCALARARPVRDRGRGARLASERTGRRRHDRGGHEPRAGRAQSRDRPGVDGDREGDAMTTTQLSGAAAEWQAAAEVQPLVKNWWMMAGRGVLAVLFGVAIVLWRIPVFDVVIVSFGTYAIADGILAIASALRAARPLMTGWPIALEGIISICFGLLALRWPFLPRGAIGVLIAWAVLTGICEIVAAVGLPRKLAAHWLVGTGGAFSIFLALLALGLALGTPYAGSDRVVLALAAYAIVFGIVILLASLRFRRAALARRSQNQRRPVRDEGASATGNP